MLFYWDGATELVTDIDYVFYGATGNTPVNKTGVMVGASTYLPDTADVPANHAPLNMVVMGVPPTQHLPHRLHRGRAANHGLKRRERAR